MPFICFTFISSIVGNTRIPNQAYAGIGIIFLSNNVSSPIIQAYFRKDIIDSLKAFMKCCHNKLTNRSAVPSTSNYDETQTTN